MRAAYGAIDASVDVEERDDAFDDANEMGLSSGGSVTVSEWTRRRRWRWRWIWAVVAVASVAVVLVSRGGTAARSVEGGRAVRARARPPFELPADLGAALARLDGFGVEEEEDDAPAMLALPNGQGVIVSHAGGLNATLRRVKRLLDEERAKDEEKVLADADKECRMRAVLDDGGLDGSAPAPSTDKMTRKLERARKTDGNVLKTHDAMLAARAEARLGFRWPRSTPSASSAAQSALDTASDVNAKVSAADIVEGDKFCWKESYGRGVGKTPSECPGQRVFGAFCYDHCSKFGSNFEPFGADCHQTCRPQDDDHGLLCHNGNWGRGWGESHCAWYDAAELGLAPQKSKSTSKSSNSRALLDFLDDTVDWFEDAGRAVTGQIYLVCGGKACPAHLEGCLLLCYPRCPSTHPVEIGCNLCGIDCDREYGGGTAPSCMKKTVFSPGLDTKSCEPGYEADAGLCYRPCAPGYTGVGPVCWGDAPDGWVNCGMGAAEDDAVCAKTLADQILGPLETVAFVATLGGSGAATAAAKAGTSAAKVSQVSTAARRLREHLPDAAMAADTAQSAFEDLESAETDTDKARAAASLISAIDPTGISGTIAAYTFDTCDRYVTRTTDGSCDETKRGYKDEHYRGCQTKTRSGRTCQHWNTLWPHVHEHHDPGPEYDTGDHNYCRNPDRFGETIWCYTTDPAKRWEYCDTVEEMELKEQARRLLEEAERRTQEQLEAAGISQRVSLRSIFRHFG